MIEYDYYKSAKISLMYKNGLIKREPVIHSNPVDYGLTEAQAIAMKISFLNSKIKPIKERIERVSTHLAFCKNKESVSFGLMILEDDEKELSKLKKSLSVYQKIKKDLKNNNRDELEAIYKNNFNIETLKQIPIDNFVEIIGQNKFRVRDERTPSCYWYKDDNTWVDFGGDNRKMDVIDLVQKIYKTDFIGACKILKNY